MVDANLPVPSPSFSTPPKLALDQQIDQLARLVARVLAKYPLTEVTADTGDPDMDPTIDPGTEVRPFLREVSRG